MSDFNENKQKLQLALQEVNKIVKEIRKDGYRVAVRTNVKSNVCATIIKKIEVETTSE